MVTVNASNNVMVTTVIADALKVKTGGEVPDSHKALRRCFLGALIFGLSCDLPRVVAVSAKAYLSLGQAHECIENR